MQTYTGKTSKGTEFSVKAGERDGSYCIALTIQSRGVNGIDARETAVQGTAVLQTKHAVHVPGHGKVGPAVPITPELRVWLDAAKAEFEAAMAARAAMAEDNIRSGRVPIELTYHDGEYLQGHTCHDRLSAKLLMDLGLAREVSGWGVHVDHTLVTALGESFNYQQAAEFAAPAIAAKEAAKSEAQATRDAIFATARETGKRQVLNTRMEECDGSARDCSYDAVTTWAMPDGTTTTTRTHTH